MDEQLQQLVLQVQQAKDAPMIRQRAIVGLADYILKSRPILRNRQGRSLSGISLEIYEALRLHVQQEIDQTIDHHDFIRKSVREWKQSLQQDALHTVLNRTRLQQLALEVQRHQFQVEQLQVEQLQYIKQELVQALLHSDKLLRLSQFPDVHNDAVNTALLWVCQNIQKFDANRGDFLDWVNYRLRKIAQEMNQQQHDPYVQSARKKVMRTRYQISAWVKRITFTHLLVWLTLYFKARPPHAVVILEFVALLSIALLVAHSPQLLGEIAQALSPEVPSRTYAGDDANMIETIPQADDSLSPSEQLRQYIQEDPNGMLSQQRMRDRPDITLQKVILDRLDHKSWKEISEAYSIKVAALSNFFQRKWRELEPQIRDAMQD